MFYSEWYTIFWFQIAYRSTLASLITKELFVPFDTYRGDVDALSVSQPKNSYPMRVGILL